MRERISRGKRVDNDEWVEGFYVNVPEHYKQEMSGKSYIVSINNGLFMEVAPETVGEYTGLTDKNGKRICEGDIVKTYNEYIAVIIFEGAMFLVKCEGYDFQFSQENCPDIEVIGNIHDNPELLEVEE